MKSVELQMLLIREQMHINQVQMLKFMALTMLVVNRNCYMMDTALEDENGIVVGGIECNTYHISVTIMMV